MPRSFYLQIALYVFCMLLGAFGMRYSFLARPRISRLLSRVVLIAGILCFCLGLLMVLAVGRTYPEYYGVWSWNVPDEYKALATVLLNLTP